VFLRTAPLGPVMQMEIDYRLTADGGAPLAGVIDNTVHRAAPAFDGARRDGKATARP
jgi:hypothetical protein